MEKKLQKMTKIELLNKIDLLNDEINYCEVKVDCKEQEISSIKRLMHRLIDVEDYEQLKSYADTAQEVDRRAMLIELE